MKTLKIIIIATAFFFWFSQKIFAENICDTKNIANYFQMQNPNLKIDNKKFKNFIDSKRLKINKDTSWTKLEKIKQINKNFIKMQDEKFSIAIEYVIKKFAEEDEAKQKWKTSEKKYLKLLEKFKTWTWTDFFVKNYLESKKIKKLKNWPANIPTSVLQNSVYLDFLIFSCELWNFNDSIQLEPWWFIKDFLSDTKTNDFEVEEFLEKQQIVVKKALDRYQSFLINREMYIALRGVIEKLEHLKWRFEDLARLIWFLPAKIVDFGYQWN